MMKEPIDHLTEEQLLAYRDGELLDFNLEMHIMSCDDCRKKLDQLGRLKSLVGAALKKPAGPKDEYLAKRRLLKKEPLRKSLSLDAFDDMRASKAMFSRRMAVEPSKVAGDTILEQARELIRRPQRKQSIGKFYSTDLEKRPAEAEQDDARVRITGHEKPGQSEVCISVRDRYTDNPKAGIDITLLPEAGGFENKLTDSDGEARFVVPKGNNRLIIHTKIPLETILINIPE